MPPTTRKRKSAPNPPTEAPVDAEAIADSKRQKQLPVRAKDEDASQDATRTPAPAKGNLKVFTDEDDEASPVVAPMAAPEPTAPVGQDGEEEEEEEEDSDDEAPEEVSTTRVASDVKKASQAAQKAAQEQATAQKRKRQQRDALFKQQADDRKKLEEGAKAMAHVLSGHQEEPASEDDADAQVEATRRRRRTDKVQIPNLLPAEFLTDGSSEDEDEDEGEQAGAAARPKKRRIGTIERTLDRQGRGPQDTRVGSTIYRVSKKVDESMAPKLRKHAKSSRDLLLKRNRAPIKPRSGFFKK